MTANLPQPLSISPFLFPSTTSHLIMILNDNLIEDLMIMVIQEFDKNYVLNIAMAIPQLHNQPFSFLFSSSKYDPTSHPWPSTYAESGIFSHSRGIMLWSLFLFLISHNITNSLTIFLDYITTFLNGGEAWGTPEQVASSSLKGW